MRQSKLFYKTKKQAPRDAEVISHKLLVRADFIEQLAAGVWTYLPLGWRVHQKIAGIIREEMNAIEGQEIHMPAMQPKDIWEISGRWDKIDPPLFKFQDRHKKWLCLGPTHEEVVTTLAKTRIESYKDLPMAVYQIQNKFRNEMRSTGGLLRVREFVMKDLYSFHAKREDLDDYYEKVLRAYKNIFSRCSLEAVAVEASSGTIGGNVCHEFMVLAKSGEDKVLICEKCGWAANLDLGNLKKCKKCGANLKEEKAIEAGHIFKLDNVYSKKMDLKFSDEAGRKKQVLMGCYGIGLGRLEATVAEALSDKHGLVWPESLSPFNAHLINLNSDLKRSDEVYQILIKKGIDVLYDDRSEVSAGEKLTEADLLGISHRLVVSKKTKKQVEYKKRDEKGAKVIDLEEAISLVK